MSYYKRDIGQFFVWLRNGISFCVTWFLLLLLMRNQILDIDSLSTDSLLKMLLFVTGGVLIFSLIFTKVIIKKWRFVTRLTWFMILISIYECIGFYWLGLFEDKGTVIQWLIFAGIVLASYFISIGIYSQYSKKRGELYTQALQNYQNRTKSTRASD